jgi:hypothetical protein
VPAEIGDDRAVTTDPPGPRFPARLHVLLARSGSRAVVLRRGPSKQVCVLGWDRRHDTFEEGQWLRGRIYERRCDLSPDGRYLIYFAMNGRWNSPTGGSWTAISRAPWLRALVLLGKGDGWHGGGLFTGPDRYWLNDGYGHRVLQDSKHVRRDLDHGPSTSYGGECPGVYYHRLQRDGWSFREHIGGRLQALSVFEKDLGGGWLLRKLAHEEVGAPVGKGCYWDEHELEHGERGLRIACPDWEWAERDGGRLVFASRGCLYRVARPKADALAEPKLLRDFNDMRFVAREAPYRS